MSEKGNMGHEERRTSPRLNAVVPVKVGADGARGETRDISEGGLGLVVKKPLERGSSVEIELVLNEGAGASVKTMATVMWSAAADTGAHVAGLRFDGPSPEALERLKKFLAEKG
jgi:c-di-GMP-binding flagellar brake protein YcgR